MTSIPPSTTTPNAWRALVARRSVGQSLLPLNGNPVSMDRDGPTVAADILPVGDGHGHAGDAAMDSCHPTPPSTTTPNAWSAVVARRSVCQSLLPLNGNPVSINRDGPTAAEADIPRDGDGHGCNLSPFCTFHLFCHIDGCLGIVVILTKNMDLVWRTWLRL